MRTVACKDCGQPISRRAASCPNCGRPVKRKGSCLLQAIVALVVIGLGIWWLTTGMVQQANVTMGQIKNQVAEDAVAQYRIAANQGDRIQKCVQAGMVAAAYLQAQDSADYDRWKAVEKRDCRKAGVSR